VKICWHTIHGNSAEAIEVSCGQFVLRNCNSLGRWVRQFSYLKFLNLTRYKPPVESL